MLKKYILAVSILALTLPQAAMGGLNLQQIAGYATQAVKSPTIRFLCGAAAGIGMPWVAKKASNGDFNSNSHLYSMAPMYTYYFMLPLALLSWDLKNLCTPGKLLSTKRIPMGLIGAYAAGWLHEKISGRTADSKIYPLDVARFWKNLIIKRSKK